MNENTNININFEEELTKEKEPREYTKRELLIIESVKKIKHPYRMITVQDVMKDLHICEANAYKLFKREDFPSIKVGKKNQIMLLPYLLWKMEKRN